MKRIFSAVFAVLLIFSVLTSCSSNKGNKSFEELYDEFSVKCVDITETLYKSETEKALSEYNIASDLIRNAVFMRAPDSNIRSDELIVIEAVSMTAVEDLKTVFAKIQQEKYKKWESLDGAEFEKVKDYKTVSHGKYMIYVVCDGADSVISSFDEIFK